MKFNVPYIFGSFFFKFWILFTCHCFTTGYHFSLSNLESTRKTPNHSAFISISWVFVFVPIYPSPVILATSLQLGTGLRLEFHLLNLFKFVCILHMKEILHTVPHTAYYIWCLYLLSEYTFIKSLLTKHGKCFWSRFD